MPNLFNINYLKHCVLAVAVNTSALWLSPYLNHSLNGSLHCVNGDNGKGQSLATYEIETPQPIKYKCGAVDYVTHICPFAKFGEHHFSRGF